MADGLSDEALREAANNRGLRLVKSRRRKPGVGDFGRFGLADAEGKQLFGFGDDGLTATAGEIAAYLRRGEQSTWAESARATRATVKPKPRPAAAIDASKQEDRKPRPIEPASRGASPRATASVKQAKRGEASPPAANAERLRTTRPVEAPVRAAQVKPELAIRPARREDAGAVAALAALLGGDVDEAAVARLIADSGRAREPVLVADLGNVVGVLAWQAIRTLRHGTIGRVTALIVAPRHRRSGIGRRLLDSAADAMRGRGCVAVEAISDIDIRNAHGFFRAADFQQTSYRFLRTLG